MFSWGDHGDHGDHLHDLVAKLWWIAQELVDLTVSLSAVSSLGNVTDMNLQPPQVTRTHTDAVPQDPRIQFSFSAMF